MSKRVGAWLLFVERPGTVVVVGKQSKACVSLPK